MVAPTFNLQRSAAACVFVLVSCSWPLVADSADNDHDHVEDDSNPCQLYIAKSTIPNAGLGVFAGTSFREDEMIGRVGDAAFPTVDQDWHNSPEGTSNTKGEADYHWPLTNYDWNAPDIGMGAEAEDISVTVTGFGAAPNCHFRLLNVHEHAASYDNAGLDRYTSPGAGASTPWFNRTSTAIKDIEAGSELFVDYGPNWFLSREGSFDLVPVSSSFEKAQAFLRKYGKLLVGSDNRNDLVEDKMALSDEAQRDLWNIIKTFPYPTRERQALPQDHKDAIRAIHGDIQVIEKENSIRAVEDLKENGKCMDNIVPRQSNIPHAGRGAFATRFIAKGGLVAPAPLVHIADKSAANMYEERIGNRGNIVRNDTAMIQRQLITNYMFGHPNSTVLLFPYSSNVPYINHHSTEYNAELRWATDAPWIHNEDWLTKPVSFLEEQWQSGLMMEFIALRDIQPGEEVLINYGDDWQKAWDEHLKNWKPISPESDYNNLTMWNKLSKASNGKDGYIRMEVFNNDKKTPIKTVEEQLVEPYHSALQIMCRVNVNHRHAYLFELETVPFFTRQWESVYDMPMDADEIHSHKCNITERYDNEDSSDDEDEEATGHQYYYSVMVDVIKQVGDEGKVEERHEIESVPRHAIEFINLPYTSDAFLKNSFRHEMQLPNGMFPKAWMEEEQKVNE